MSKLREAVRSAVLIAAMLCACAGESAAQSSPGLVYGQVPSAAQWNSYFAGKVDYPIGQFTTSAPGLVPASLGLGSTYFLAADGVFRIPAGGSALPGGSPGQVQFNNTGVFGGFTVGGDATLNTSTGALTVTKSNGVAFGSAAFAAIGTSGATVGLLNGGLTFGGADTFTQAPTITALAGGGTQCVQVNNAGLLGVTGTPCGSGGGAVSSVFARTGAVTAQSGDYSFSLLSGSAACGQLPALTGDTTTSAGNCGTTTAKVNGVAYGASPSTNTLPVVTGANAVTYEAVPNAALANSSLTIAGHSVALGGTQAIAFGDLTGSIALSQLGSSYTNGQLLIGSTTDGFLHAGTLTAGLNITITNSPGGITIAASGGGGGCSTSGTAGNLLNDNGSGGCASDTSTSLSAGALSLGSSGVVGSLTLGNAASGTVKLQAVAGALGSVTASLPANTGTIAETNLAQTFSAVQSYGSGDLSLNGSSSGALVVKPAAAAGSNTLTLPAGTTDFSATGGANQVVQQSSAGGAFTVGQLAFSALSGSAACGQLPALTGDTTSSAGNCATTTGKVNGVSYGASPATNMVAVVTGSNATTYEAVPNAALANSSITFGATAVSLGSTVSAFNAVNIGPSTAGTGAFTTLSASSTVSGAGITSLFASPPAIGGTAAAAGSFTTLMATGTITYDGTLSSSAHTTAILDSSNGTMFGSCAVSGCGTPSGALTAYFYTFADTVASNATVGINAFGSPAAINLNLTAKGAGCVEIGGTCLAPSATTDTTNASNISSGTLAVARGGSGAGTFTTHGVLLGEGTGAFGVTGAGTSGFVLTSNGASADPTFQAAPGGISSVTGTSPIVSSGGSTPAISCATCVIASSPGAGVAHFAGSTQAVTSSAVVPGDFGTQTAATALMGPTSGSAATPSFRALASTDLPGVLDTTKTASYTVNASEQDIGNALSLVAVTGTPALTLPTASSTVFAPGQTLTISVPFVTSAVNWTLTNSTGLTLRGLNSTTLVPGTQGTFVANADAATLDFFPGMQAPTATALGGVFSSTPNLAFGTLINGDLCSYTSSGTTINCNTSSSGVTWPTTGDVVISNSTSSPAGVAPSGTNCLVSSSGSWTTGSCGGGGSSAPVAPQGRLTLQANKPVMTADATAQTTLRYDSYQGNQVPVWNGSAMVGLAITSDEITMGLSTTNHPASGFFDVFGVSNSGSLALCTVAWTNGTTRASAVSLKSGVWTIASAPTHCYGGAAGATDLAGSIGGANEATLLGCMATTSTNGQTAMQFTPAAASGGSNTWRGITNAYNMVTQGSRAKDSNANWTIASTSFAALDASNSNRVSFFDCLGQLQVDVELSVDNMVTTSGYDLYGICINSTSCTPGDEGLNFANNSVVNNLRMTIPVRSVFAPTLGFNYVQAVESYFSAAGTDYGPNGVLNVSTGY